MGWSGLGRERTGPRTNGWKLGYPPSRALEAACRSRGQRQGSGRCGQDRANGVRSVSNQSQIARAQRGKGSEAVEATTGRRVADVRVLNGQREE
jgi:hypothetical protein